MARRKHGSPPAYIHDARSGQARLNWPLGGGRYRTYYLGAYGSPESYAEYNRLVTEWTTLNPTGRPSSHSTPPSDQNPTINELLEAYLTWAATEYPDPPDNTSSELKNIKAALRPLSELYGHTDAHQFGPLALEALQAHLVQTGLCRSTLNSRVNRIRRFFKWCVRKERLPDAVLTRLQTVPGLRKGRGRVREADPIQPVPLTIVELTLPHLPPPVAAMVRLQVLTACRPSELMALTAGQIDRSAATWAYRPHRHKTIHHGKDRVIFIGPEAQAILAPFIAAHQPDQYLFSPAEHVEALRAARAKSRKSKRPPSQLVRQRKANPQRAPRDHYDRRSYYVAVQRAVKTARGLRAVAVLRAGGGAVTVRQAHDQAVTEIPSWSPLQLRHTAATAIRQRFGLETARVILGHSRIETTQIYAERDLEAAASAIAQIG